MSITSVTAISERGIQVIKKQREKEFLFELERLCHNYYLVIDIEEHTQNSLVLREANQGDIDKTTEFIENFIDELRADR